MTHDVAVVGAGAAGAATAVHLALRGRSVVLIDSLAAPRHKPCGGGMAASVQRWFPFPLTPTVEGVINQVRFTWCLGDPVLADLPGEAPFWIVRRDRFDSYLADRACEAGADRLEGWQVQEVRRDEQGWELQLSDGQGRRELRSRALVVADGSRGGLAQRLGLGDPQPRLVSCLAVEVDGPVAHPSQSWFEFGLVRYGFCWCFPRQGGYTIGVGTLLGREETDHGAVVDQLLPALGLPADAGVRRPWQQRLWNGHHRLHGEGVVVVGDAASLADPFLAEGLRPALLSGCRAAEALDQWLAGESTALAGYSRSLRQEWGESMAWGRRIGQVFYRLPRVGYQLGIKRPTAPRRIAQILSGEMGYGDIAQRVIRRLGGGLLGGGGGA